MKVVACSKFKEMFIFKSLFDLAIAVVFIKIIVSSKGNLEDIKEISLLTADKSLLQSCAAFA